MPRKGARSYAVNRSISIGARRWILYAFAAWPILVLWGSVGVLGFVRGRNDRIDFFLVAGGVLGCYQWVKIADRKGWSERFAKGLGLSYRD